MASEKDEAAAVQRENDERYIEGLREELRGYETRGGDEYDARADQVRAELRRVGAKVDDARPTGRRAPVKETAAGDHHNPGQARPAAKTAGEPAKTTTAQPGVDQQ